VAEKVLKLDLKRDYKKFLYFIDGEGNVAEKLKTGDGATRIVVAHVVHRDNSFLYFIDKEGDVARTPRSRWSKATTEEALAEKILTRGVRRYPELNKAVAGDITVLVTRRKGESPEIEFTAAANGVDSGITVWGEPAKIAENLRTLAIWLEGK
jgi:hypothetical protein